MNLIYSALTYAQRNGEKINFLNATPLQFPQTVVKCEYFELRT